jgi:hypothetical protein
MNQIGKYLNYGWSMGEVLCLAKFDTKNESIYTLVNWYNYTQ